MEIYTYIVCGIFALWLIGTIIVQFKETGLSERIKSVDFLSLLPLWTFFAPNPGVNDYHLLYRDENESGDRSIWEEIEINENRKLLTCIWNPNKRGKKILCDVIQNIVPMTRELQDRPRIMMVTLPYMLILNAIMKEPKLFHDTSKKQFLLAASDGYEKNDEPKLVLISEFHPV